MYRNNRTSNTKKDRFRSEFQENTPVSFSVLFKSVFSGVLFAFICNIVLVLIACIAVYATNDPGKYVTAAAAVCLLLSALAGGIFSCRKDKRRALLRGLLCGLMYLAILLIISLPFPKDSSSKESGRFILGMSVPAVSVLGALITKYKRAKPRKRKKF